MDERSAVISLTNGDYDTRLDTITKLDAALGSSGCFHPFLNCLKICEVVAEALFDEELDTKEPCLNFIAELIVKLDDDQDECINAVLPAVLNCLGDFRSAIRLSAIEITKTCLKLVNDFQATLQVVIERGIQAENPEVSIGIIANIHVLFANILSKRNLSKLVQSLLGCLFDSSLQMYGLDALGKLCASVGREKFDVWLNQAPESSVDYYHNMLSDIEDGILMTNNNDLKFDQGSHSMHSGDNISDCSMMPSRTSVSSQINFGIIPSNVINHLKGDGNFHSRSNAVEELERTVENCQNIELLYPHLKEFVEFLLKLMEERNAKISESTLNVIKTLLSKCSSHRIKAQAAGLFMGLVEHLGDGLPFIRDAIMEIITQMIQMLTPKLMMVIICDNLNQVKFRQDLLNIIIFSLLKFPSTDFDLEYLCQPVSQLLLDSKRQVRQASLECLAVLGQLIGPPYHAILSSVGALENSVEGSGVTKAVVERLSARRLPKFSEDGTIEYVSRISRNGMPVGADVEWILSVGSSRVSSGRSINSDSLYLESVESSARSSPSLILHESPTTRRNRQRPNVRSSHTRFLPWNKDNPNPTRNGSGRRPQIQSAHEISSDQTTPRRDSSTCPFPRSAKMVRNGSTRRIHSHTELSSYDARNEFSDSGYSSQRADSASLNRNVSQNLRSAGTVRVKRLFDKLEKGLTSARSVPSLQKKDLEAIDDCAAVQNKRQEFESLVQVKGRRMSQLPSQSTPPSENSIPTEYNPHSGVTFRNTPVSDVLEIAGKGYSEDSHTVDPQPSTLSVKAREKRRNSKVMFGLMSETLNSNNNSAMDDGRQPSNLRGKSPYPTPGKQAIAPVDNGAGTDLLSGIFGKGVRNKTQDQGLINGVWEEERTPITFKAGKRSSIGEADAPNDVVQHQLHRINSYEQQLQRQKDEMERLQNEKQNQLRITNRQIQQLHMDGNQFGDGDSYKVAEDIRTQPDNDFHPVNKPPVKTVKKKTKPEKEKVLTEEAIPPPPPPPPPQDLPSLFPSKNPAALLSEAFRNLSSNSEEWELNTRGLEIVRLLVMHHPDTLIADLQNVNLAVTEQIKNLRSQVIVLAIKCLSSMYAVLKKNMDMILDSSVIILLNKTGVGNNFIKAESDQALQVMVDNVTPQRALATLVTNGASHRHDNVRNTTSQLIFRLTETLGPDYILSGVKDITDKILMTSAKFMIDKSQDVRSNGQRIFSLLMTNDDFDVVMRRYISSDMLSKIQDKLDSLQQKRLSGTNEIKSAYGGRAPLKRNGSTRGSSVTRRTNVDGAATLPSATGPQSRSEPVSASSSAKGRRPARRVDEATMDRIKEMMVEMESNEFQTRNCGISKLSDMVDNGPVYAIGANITKIFDKFVPCLKDSNRKTNLYALEVLLKILPTLSPHISSNVVGFIVPTIVGNLASKHREIHDAAANVLDLFIEVLDPVMLLQPFTSQALTGNARYKHEMVDRVTNLVERVYPSKPKLISMNVLPLVWHLLGMLAGSGTSAGSLNDLRPATRRLVLQLHYHMENGLLESARSDSKVSSHMKHILQDMIDNS